jgi:hypothetical protein
MRVHGLGISGNRPAVPKALRKQLRAELHQLEAAVTNHSISHDLALGKIQVLRGKLGNAFPLHQSFAASGLKNLSKLESDCDTSLA